jgi:hypothetical protein
MSEHKVHPDHTHTHGTQCGHVSVEHDGHTDYIHDGHLHSVHGDHVDEHALTVAGTNPASCTPSHACQSHDASHSHRSGCGHEAVPHGDHTDFLVAEHLHHPHSGHCDDHGVIRSK